MVYIFCPACFNPQDPDNSRKLLLSSLMTHFLYYHGWKPSADIKFRCVEEKCRKLNGNEYRYFFNIRCVVFKFRMANTLTIKKGLMQLKSYYNHCNLKHNRDISHEDALNLPVEYISFDTNNDLNIQNEDEPFVDTNLTENIELFESLDSDYEDNNDLPFDYFQQRNPSNVDEWKKYFMEIIFDFFKHTSGTESYFKDIILLLKRALFPIKHESVTNPKSALLGINFRNLINKGKEIIETIKVTDPDETIINNDETDNDIVKRDKQLFYYLPLKLTIPQLIKRLNIPQTDSIGLIIYGDDIQTNNSLGSHTKTGSFLHICFKLHIPGNDEIAKQCSKLENIVTLGIVLSEVTKFSKYDWLLEHIKKMLNNLEVIHFGKKLNFYIFCFCGDHVFLQDVFNLPKNFKGEGGSSCRTCLIEGRNFKRITLCNDANKDEVLRKERFNSVLEYPLNEYSDPFHDILEGVLPNVIYSVVQKLTFFDSQYCPLPKIFMNWNPVEIEIRKYNKKSKDQNISSIITNNFFSKYTTRENIEKKNKFRMSGSEQLALAKALLHCMTSKDTTSLFKHTVNEVFYSSRKILNEILQIYNIINLKNELKDSEILRLESLINSFIRNYFEYIIDESKFSMKYHVLQHYPLFARRYRSFVAISCIRFESKNRLIKTLHSISNNKRNPAYTIMGKIGLHHLICNEIAEMH